MKKLFKTVTLLALLLSVPLILTTPTGKLPSAYGSRGADRLYLMANLNNNKNYQ